MGPTFQHKKAELLCFCHLFLCGAFAMYIQGARDILHSPDLEVQ